jgi:hypothetical protein
VPQPPGTIPDFVRALSHVGEFGIGQTEGFGELALDAVKFLVLNALTFGGYGTYSLGKALWQGYKEHGVVGAVNAINPLYQIARHAADMLMAIEREDYRAAGNSEFKGFAVLAAAAPAVAQGVGALQGAAAGAGRGGAASGGGAMVELYHGTTASGAKSIMTEGLMPVSRHTAPFPAGSFFTHVGANAQLAASHWAARSGSLYGGSPTLLRGTMSQELFNTLSAQGLIKTGPVPGLPLFPPQTVILPEGLGAASAGIRWSVAPLTL